jgi:hypothetical protein
MNEWQQWKKEQEEKRLANLPPAVQVAEKKKRQKAEWRRITEDELRKVKALQGVSTSRASSDGRFISTFRIAGPETQITAGMAAFVEILWYKYRKQLKHNDPKPEGYR